MYFLFMIYVLNLINIRCLEFEDSNFKCILFILLFYSLLFIELINLNTIFIYDLHITLIISLTQFILF